MTKRGRRCRACGDRLRERLRDRCPTRYVLNFAEIATATDRKIVAIGPACDDADGNDAHVVVVYEPCDCA